MAQTPKLSRQTFDLAKMLHHLKMAELYQSTILKSQYVKLKAKNAVTTINRRTTASINEFRMLVTAESLTILEEELLPQNCAVQFDYVCNAFLEMAPDLRDEVEKIVEELHEKYVLSIETAK